MQAPVSQRCAVGLARALQAGALYATAQTPSWNLDEFKPVLAAHAAVTAGRNAAAAALREVLRELYPAALRAYPDPAEHVPLRILEELSEPSLLSPSPSNRARDAALIADLTGSGAADETTAVNAITALRVAVEESPRWHTNRALAPVVAETVRQSVAAVRACDAASAALVGTLVERLGALSTQPQAPYVAAAAPVSPAIPRRAPGPAAEVPWGRRRPREPARPARRRAVCPPHRGSCGRFRRPIRVRARSRSSTDRAAPRRVARSGRCDRRRTTTSRRSTPACRRRRTPAVSSGGSTPAYTDANTLSFSMDPLNAPLQPGRRSRRRSGWSSPPARRPGPAYQRTRSPRRRPADRPLPAPPALRVIDGGRQSAPPRPVGRGRGHRSADLLADPVQLGLVPHERRDRDLARAAALGRPPGRRGLAGRRAAVPACPSARTPGPACPAACRGQPRARLRSARRAASCASCATRRASPSTPRATSAGGSAGRRSAASPVGQRDRAAWEFNREQRAREGADPRARLS